MRQRTRMPVVILHDAIGNNFVMAEGKLAATIAVKVPIDSGNQAQTAVGSCNQASTSTTAGKCNHASTQNAAGGESVPVSTGDAASAGQEAAVHAKAADIAKAKQAYEATKEAASAKVAAQLPVLTER